MMLRKDKEILDSELIDFILNKAEICRVAFSQEDQPYLVPLSFGYEPGHIYFHCAPRGRKLDIIKVNPRVCFEVEYGCELVRADTPCNFTVHFSSVIGFGKASIIADPARKAHGLDQIVKHYGAIPPVYEAGELANLAVVDIEIEELSCKKSPNP
jgi:nitroimidazol reductase NimA-like FMN-containing flavoprotein (pyridoxamine 5'-phosphate oxidase superfamily)